MRKTGLELFRIPADVLVVVDYAETQPGRLERIFELLEEPRPVGARRRLLLLARSPEQWWEELCRRVSDPLAALLYDATYELPALFEQGADRQREFLTAVAAFAAAGGYRTGGLVPPAGLGDERFAHALTLHMTALAALLDCQWEQQASTTPARLDPVARVLDHEQRYWADAAQAEHLPHARQRLLDAVMAAATCCGAASRDEAVRVLSALPDLAGEHVRVLGRYADWAHQLHPGDGWLNPLEPDLLGEYFVARTLRNQQDLAVALAHGARRKEQQLQLVTVLARAASQNGDMRAVTTQVLAAGTDELWLAGAMLAAYLPQPSVLTEPLLDTLAKVDSAEILWAAAREIASSHRVSELKIAAASEALHRYRALPDHKLAREADLLDALASGLFYAGRDDEAVEVLREVVGLYARLARQDPTGHTLNFARAMINYGEQLAAADEGKKALDLAKQVTDLSLKGESPGVMRRVGG